MIVQHEERVTQWRAYGHYGYSRVRIWQRLTPFGMFQRHEWERDDGSRHAEQWIPGGKSWAQGASKSSESIPSETDLLLDAVRRIAKGHNDPRALALEILDSIGEAA